jgi:hypothetical protein
MDNLIMGQKVIGYTVFFYKAMGKRATECQLRVSMDKLANIQESNLCNATFPSIDGKQFCFCNSVTQQVDNCRRISPRVPGGAGQPKRGT